jgi:internalin A
MVSYFCDADPSRLFTNALRTDGYTEFFDTADNECLSPAGGSTAAGATIVQYTCDADPSRGWATAFIPSVDSSQFHLVDEYSGLCVAPSGAGSNAALVQEPCSDDDVSQRWYRSWADQLRNVHSQLCMYSKNPGLNTSVNQTFCGGPYKLTVDTSGSYIVQDALDGLCLSPAGGSTVKNAPIVEYHCDGDPARHWTITWFNGIYAFQNVKSGMCLSPAGGSVTPASSIVQYYCDGDPSRLWTVEPQ